MFAHRALGLASKVAVPPVFDVANNTGSTFTTGGSTKSLTHVASAQANMAIVYLKCNGNVLAGNSMVLTVVWGGVTIPTPLDMAFYGSGGISTLGPFGTNTTVQVHQVYVLQNPPTGSQTVSGSVTSGTVNGTLRIATATYKGVSGYGGTVQKLQFQTGTSLSQTVTSSAGRVISQAFGGNGLNTTTSYNQNSRTSAPGGNFLVGDAAGAASVNFTATNSGATAWSALAFDLY